MSTPDLQLIRQLTSQVDNLGVDRLKRVDDALLPLVQKTDDICREFFSKAKHHDPALRDEITKLRKKQVDYVVTKVHNVSSYTPYQLEERKKIAQELANINTSDNHFVFEMVQNADDCQYHEKETAPALSFFVFSDRIVVRSNEIGFAFKDLLSITSIAMSSKSGNQQQKNSGGKKFIGEKGIGFMSLFKAAKEIEVYSNGFSFRFREDSPYGPKTPEWIDGSIGIIESFRSKLDPHSTAPGSGTWFVLHLKRPLQQGKSIHGALSKETMLFLNKLKHIKFLYADAPYNTASDSVFQPRRQEDWRVERDAHSGHVAVRSGQEIHHFIVHSIDVRMPADMDEPKRRGVTSTSITIAFPLTDHAQATAREAKRSEGRFSVFAFLPLEKELGPPFLINSDFILTANRETIQADLKWNQELRKGVVSCFLDALRTIFKKSQALACSYLRYLIPSTKGFALGFFQDSIDDIVDALKKEPSLLGADDKWHIPVNIIIPPSAEIRKLIPHEQLAITGKCYISQYVNQLEYFSLLDRLGSGSLTAGHLKCLNTYFAKASSDTLGKILSFSLQHSMWHGDEGQSMAQVSLFVAEGNTQKPTCLADLQQFLKIVPEWDEIYAFEEAPPALTNQWFMNRQMSKALSREARSMLTQQYFGFLFCTVNQYFSCKAIVKLLKRSSHASEIVSSALQMLVNHQALLNRQVIQEISTIAFLPAMGSAEPQTPSKLLLPNSLRSAVLSIDLEKLFFGTNCCLFLDPQDIIGTSNDEEEGDQTAQTLVLLKQIGVRELPTADELCAFVSRLPQLSAYDDRILNLLSLCDQIFNDLQDTAKLCRQLRTLQIAVEFPQGVVTRKPLQDIFDRNETTRTFCRDSVPYVPIPLSNMTFKKQLGIKTGVTVETVIGLLQQLLTSGSVATVDHIVPFYQLLANQFPNREIETIKKEFERTKLILIGSKRYYPSEVWLYKLDSEVAKLFEDAGKDSSSLCLQNVPQYSGLTNFFISIGVLSNPVVDPAVLSAACAPGVAVSIRAKVLKMLPYHSLPTQLIKWLQSNFTFDKASTLRSMTLYRQPFGSGIDDLLATTLSRYSLASLGYKDKEIVEIDQLLQKLEVSSHVKETELLDLLERCVSISKQQAIAIYKHLHPRLHSASVKPQLLSGRKFILMFDSNSKRVANQVPSACWMMHSQELDAVFPGQSLLQQYSYDLQDFFRAAGVPNEIPFPVLARKIQESGPSSAQVALQCYKEMNRRRFELPQFLQWVRQHNHNLPILLTAAKTVVPLPRPGRPLFYVDNVKLGKIFQDKCPEAVVAIAFDAVPQVQHVLHSCIVYPLSQYVTSSILYMDVNAVTEPVLVEKIQRWLYFLSFVLQHSLHEHDFASIRPTFEKIRRDITIKRSSRPIAAVYTLLDPMRQKMQFGGGHDTHFEQYASYGSEEKLFADSNTSTIWFNGEITDIREFAREIVNKILPCEIYRLSTSFIDKLKLCDTDKAYLQELTDDNIPCPGVLAEEPIPSSVKVEVPTTTPATAVTDAAPAAATQVAKATTKKSQEKATPAKSQPSAAAVIAKGIVQAPQKVETPGAPAMEAQNATQQATEAFPTLKEAAASKKKQKNQAQSSQATQITAPAKQQTQKQLFVQVPTRSAQAQNQPAQKQSSILQRHQQLHQQATCLSSVMPPSQK